MDRLLAPILAISSAMSMGNNDPMMGPMASAVFSAANTGIDGYVMVKDGAIDLWFNFSAIDWSELTGHENCSDGGFKYHIHEKWLHSSNDDQIGSTMCGPAYTGGHFDPWQGCGLASGNPACASCFNQSAYACDWDMNPFMCEVGDWSSKYGTLMIMDDNSSIAMTRQSSFYEVQASDLVNMSVVFHCNAGARAFCAPFTTNVTSENEGGMPPQQNVKEMAAYADFSDVLGDDSMVKLMKDGGVEIYLDATDVSGFDMDDYSCDEFDISIFNGWTADGFSQWGSDCEDEIGDAYDPTRQCIPWSENGDDESVCDSDYYLCGDSDYEYDCNWDYDRYSCAPGDLSGKFGRYADADSDAYDMTTMNGMKNTLIPRTEMMIDGGYSVVIHCPYDDASDIEILACAKLDVSYLMPSSTSTDGAYNGHSMIVSVAISFLLALFLR